MALEGQFRNFSNEARDRKLDELIETINDHVDYGFAVVISAPDYRDIFFQKVSKTLDAPYFYATTKVFNLVLFRTEATDRRDANNNRERVSFIFDEQGREANEPLIYWSSLKRFGRIKLRRRMGNLPIWAHEDSIPPLQAADLLAWTMRRMISDVLGDGSEIDSKLKGAPLYQLTKETLRHATRAPNVMTSKREIWTSFLGAQSRASLIVRKLRIKIFEDTLESNRLQHDFSVMENAGLLKDGYENGRARSNRQRHLMRLLVPDRDTDPRSSNLMG